MHGINGYVFANLPGLDMTLGDRVRWYVLALGTEMDIHTPHWHGNTGLSGGRRVDVVNLLPASSEVVDLRPDERGAYQVLSLVASDRPGLLYAVARTLAKHGVSVHTAKINTLGDRAEDVFLVSGEALTRPRQVLQLEQELLRELQIP